MNMVLIDHEIIDKSKLNSIIKSIDNLLVLHQIHCI